MTPHDSSDLWDDADAVTWRAAQFLEQRRSESWNETDQAELAAWLAQSALHEAAWLRLEGAAALTKELALFRAHKSGASPEAPQRGETRKTYFVPLLVAASILAVAAVGIPYLGSFLQPPPDRTDSTDVGGRTLVSFADGTQIELNTDTAMRFRMTTKERTVWLEKGEAWFRVAHDAGRPFSVVIGAHRVTDIGTEFLARRDADKVEVTLVNGRAALSAGGVQTATLNPGDDAVATPLSLSVTKKTPQQMADALAWRSGMLVFRNAPLSEVVRQFNRYNTTKLVIADPSIADEKVAVNARTNDYESFLQFATDALKLHVDRQGNEIFISRGPRDEGKRAAHIPPAPKASADDVRALTRRSFSEGGQRNR